MQFSRPFFIYINIIFLCTSLLSLSAMAAEEARLLPNGIKRLRVVGASARTVDQRFTDNGSLANLGGANRSVTIRDLVKADNSGQLGRLVSGLNSLKQGLGDSLYTANLYQDISLQQNIYGFAFETGISPRWNLGARFRVVQRSLRTNFRVDSQNNAGLIKASIEAGAAAPAELVNGLATVSQFNQSFFEQTLFASKGYEIPQSFDRTQLGYTEVGAKYAVYRDENWATSLLGGVRLPTGTNESLTNPLDKGTGSNYWGVGLQGFQEWSPNSTLSLGTAAKYEYYFSDTRRRAVPRDENDALPSLLASDGQVQDVKRKPGGKFDAEFATTLKFFEDAFSVWGAYQYSRKAKDQFSGPGNLYYSGLEKETNYWATFAEVGVEYSTIPAFRKQAFFMPLQLSLLYNTALAGRNTPDAEFARVDLKVYF